MSGLILGPTHGGLVVDRQGRVYISADGEHSVVVLVEDGALVRCLDSEWSGLHAMQLAEEGGEEFLLGTHLPGRRVVKLTLEGRQEWSLEAPMEAGCHGATEEYEPTAAVVAPDGSLSVADGWPQQDCNGARAV